MDKINGLVQLRFSHVVVCISDTNVSVWHMSTVLYSINGGCGKGEAHKKWSMGFPE